MIKVGVVGVGHLGQHHARVYSQMKGVKLVGVADTDEARGREIAKKLKCDHFSDPLALIGLVQAASIAVPTAAHFGTAMPYLKAGVHCLLEKPMTIDLKEADEIIAMAKKSGAALQVGHIERFNPAIQALKKFNFQPLFIEAHRLGPYSPRNTDIGVALELMIHDLDIVLAMVDRKVKTVEALGVPVLSRTEDIANVRLTFEGGCVANLTASRVTTKKERKIRIFSREAYVSADYLGREVKVYRLKDGADPTQAGSLIGLTKMVAMETLKIDKEEEQLKTELEAFIHAVRGGTPPEVSGEQGREAVALGLEIQRQMAAKRKEVLGS